MNTKTDFLKALGEYKSAQEKADCATAYADQCREEAGKFRVRFEDILREYAVKECGIPEGYINTFLVPTLRK